MTAPGRTARDEIMARIAAAAVPPAPPVPREYRTAPRHPAGAPALLDLLADRLRDYRAEVRACTSDELPATLAALLDELSVRRLVVPAGLDEAWTALWTDASTDASTTGPGGVVLRDDPPLPVIDLDGADAVLTGCAAAIALTGTIVLDGSAGCGRRALSLVPDVHVCVVRAGQVVDNVPQVLPLLDPRAPLTWISGPSATSDIELDRVEGVHGPRTLAVVVVRPNG